MMLAEIAPNTELGGVTLTWAMMIAAIPIGLAVELLKTVLDRFTPNWQEIKKSLLPLLGMGMSILVFLLAGMKDWFLGGVLIGLSASGGYDFVQGVTQKLGKPKPIVPVLLLCSLLLAGGCDIFASNPKAELLASQKTFSATVDSLTALQQAGKFTPQETAQLTILIHQGRNYLDQWWAAIKAGQPRPDIIAAFQVVLDTLIQTNLQKGGVS